MQSKRKIGILRLSGLILLLVYIRDIYRSEGWQLFYVIQHSTNIFHKLILLTQIIIAILYLLLSVDLLRNDKLNSRNYKVIAVTFFGYIIQQFIIEAQYYTTYPDMNIRSIIRLFFIGVEMLLILYTSTQLLQKPIKFYNIFLSVALIALTKTAHTSLAIIAIAGTTQLENIVMLSIKQLSLILFSYSFYIIYKYMKSGLTNIKLMKIPRYINLSVALFGFFTLYMTNRAYSPRLSSRIQIFYFLDFLLGMIYFISSYYYFECNIGDVIQ